jgi:hypothetical protein
MKTTDAFPVGGSLLAGFFSIFLLQAWFLLPFVAFGCGFWFFWQRPPLGWILTACYFLAQIIGLCFGSKGSPNFMEAPMKAYMAAAVAILDLPLLPGAILGFFARP